jgi:hypothetical protein
MPDAGDNHSIKANILDLVTLLTTRLALNFVRPPVSVMQTGHLGPVEPLRIGELTRQEVTRSRPIGYASSRLPQPARHRSV